MIVKEIKEFKARKTFEFDLMVDARVILLGSTVYLVKVVGLT